jgi:hypothetical protein
MGVTVNQRAPRADVVDETVAVDVDQLRAFASGDEDRVAADRAGELTPPGITARARRYSSCERPLESEAVNC